MWISWSRRSADWIRLELSTSANAASYKQQLQDLDDELRSALDAIPAERRVLVSQKEPSPIWPVITALMRPISGPSMPKARSIQNAWHD